MQEGVKAGGELFSQADDAPSRGPGAGGMDALGLRKQQQDDESDDDDDDDDGEGSEGEAAA